MKRMLSFLLSLAMIISMLPAGAFAAELETTPVAQTQAVTEAPDQQETQAPEMEAAETTAAQTEAAETESPETVAETASQEETETTEVPETTEAAVEETVAETAAATTEDDFRAAVAAAEASGENLAIWDEITLTADLTINMTGELSFADYSKLVVPSGVTLTLNCPTLINGATLTVEEGGKLISNASLSILAPLNTAAFDMNGEFVNYGQLWVNEGGIVNINGTATSWYGPIHVGFGGSGATSTLNVNGTLTTYGYLNITDGGASGAMNVAGKLILEKDESGNAYLQAANPINVTGTLDNRAAVTIGNDAGTAVLTVAEGGNLVVSDSTMWFDVAGGGSLVNNGTMTNNFYHICNYATFTNNGTLNNNAKIRNYGTYTNNGTVSGNAPVDGVEDARNVFLSQVADATASGDALTVWDEVILAEDLTINMTGELSFADYSKLIVPSGVTLTLNCPTLINGATLTVEEGGKLISNASLSILAPLNTATFDMNGEFVNYGQLWVNEGGIVNINGTATGTGPIFVGFGGSGATSTLNVNGNLSTSGYLCISNSGAPGLLNVAGGATLNILNNENGCGYLDNSSSVVIDGTVNLDGLFTTGAAKDDDGNVVGAAAYATINGTVNGSATSSIGVLEGGTLTNNGTVTAYGELTIEGTWSGTAAVENIMSFADFKAALANGYVQLDAKVTIEEALTLDASVYIHQGGEIIVPEGVTLTVNSSIRVQGGKLTVEEGGVLVNNSHIYVEQGGTMEVAGTYQAQDYNYLVAEYGESTITGVANGMISLNCQADTEEELLAAAAVSGYKEVVFNMNQPIRLTSDLELAQGMVLRVNGGATLTVASGAALTVNGNAYVFESGITVEPGATLRVTERGYVQLFNAYLHAEGATVETAVGRIHMQFDGDCEILGVDTSLVNGTCSVGTMDDLWKAVGLCSLYNFVEIEPYATVTVTSDLTIPANSMVAMYDQGELVQLIIPDGVTVTNCTTIVVNDNCQVWIQTGGTLDNSQGGGINDYTGCGVIVDGTLIEDTTGGGGSTSGVDTFEELKAAIDAGKEWIEIFGTITVTENLTVPTDSYVTVNGGGEIIVPNGVTLTLKDGMSIYDGALTVKAGGTAVLSGIYVDGTLTVEKGASFTTDGMTVLYGSTVTGVDKSTYTLMYNANTEADIREGLKITGYNWVTVCLYADVTLTANLTIPESKSLIVETYWDNGVETPVSLTIPSGKTVTNNGVLSIQGTLNNYGKIVNNGALYIYGEIAGNGTITGDGHLDYARPVYSHADLVKWLSADLVPTYLYCWGEVTLEGDVTIPEGTQLIVEGEGNMLIVPDGVTVTMNGEMYAQGGGYGTIVFRSGSELINNNLAVAYFGVLTFETGSKLVNNGAVSARRNGTINIYGTYVNNDPEEYTLQMYETGTVNGLGMEHVYYMADFADEAELQTILANVTAAGYYGASVWPVYGSGVVELSGNITIPENVYFYCGYRYGDSLVLKSGAVLTNYGTVRVYSPGTLTIEDGAELINHGEVNADEGCLIYLGGGITVSADAREIFGKGKATLTAAATPAAGAKITWTLAEGDELYATLKASGTKATLTAADVTGKKTVTVIASAVLENGTEVSETIEITVIPLVKQITLVSGGADVTGQTLTYDLANAENDKTLALSAVIGPQDAQADLQWTSSDEAVAAVADGKVSFTGKTGKVTITASATDGSKISAKVTIEAAQLVQTLSLLEGASELVGGKATQLKVQDAAEPGTALSAAQAVWALADDTYAAYVTVTPAGKVTTKAVPERISVKLLCSVVGNSAAGALEHTITVYPAVTQVDLVDGDANYTGKTVKLTKGATIVLNAVCYPADSMEGVTWDISDKDGKFVEILSSGTDALVLKATGLKGTVTVKITAADGSKKSATVKLQTGTFVEEIVVSAPAPELISGESIQLTAAVDPAEADNTAVVWSLEDANDKQFVSLSSSGKVTAKKGLSMSKTITILATAKDGYGACGSVDLQLQPADPGALVILAEDGTNITGTTVNVDLLTGGAVKLKAKYFNTDSADVTWSGKNVTFSEADANGCITASVSGKGTFTLTADDGNGKNAAVKLKAANLSERIVISGPTEVASGKSIQLKATVLPEGSVADKKVTWWIDEAHTQYASISSSGKLTAAKNLTAARSITVWAQAKDGNSEAEAYSVDILPLAQSVQILESGIDVTNTTYIWDLAVDEGNPAITAEVLAADASQAVVWKLSGAKVLQQNADGTFSVTGKTGTATVTAAAADGSNKKASFKFTVLKSMEYIAQSQTEAVIAGGKSLKLASYVTVDSEATNKKLTWSMTGDTEMATLNASGVLKTKKVTAVHTITVTATAADGSGCQAMFTVNIYPATTSVKLLCDGETAPKQATLGIGETMTLEGISLPSAAAQGPGAYTWKLSSDKFAEIQENADGTVTITGKAAGTVTVTCTAADGTGKKATLKIKIG